MRKEKHRGPGEYSISCGTIHKTTLAGTLLQVLPQPNVNVMEKESIFYESKPISDQTTRNCTHIRERMSARPGNFVYRMYSESPNRLAKCINFHFYSSRNEVYNPVRYPYPLTSSPSLTPETLAFGQRAFDAMVPDLETDLQLVNFALELTDVKHLLRFFTKWKKSVLTKAAEGHLSYSFGIRPFLSDVATLYYVLKNYKDKIHDFMSRYDTLQRRHYTEPIEYVPESSNTFYSSVNVTARTVHEAHYERHATMVYSYTGPDLFETNNQIKALRDMLGLRITPSTIWEAIPFSFLVDWIYRVQAWLQRYEKPLVPITLTVQDFCISEKSNVKIRAKCTYRDINGSYFTVDDFIRDRSAYIRRRFLPSDLGDAFINRGQYGLNQLALSASLLKVMGRGR